ncbi:glycoside hydrolase family 18 protein [Viridothelium virens]|uniref:chitinase n=1 Tax=Viridothelium virens TaxID=1048519 RepID=A0A6A6H7P4_VIRVR|nr:glycoside hydrolase family 18 protein [Viridothelium virens]
MCGKYSVNGSQPCGMNLCCSAYGWCGTDDAHCSTTGDAPCQQGFGKCSTAVAIPTCAKSGSTGGRTIGYYQVSNNRTRLCNRISPHKIDTTGYTHLYAAFAAIDPITFAVVPADTPDESKSADAQVYRDFAALKHKGLETWIAIGGFDFSDAGPTHTTWSDMVSTSANRAAFITSLQQFMARYGFQGIDIDWEYPGTPDRGGKLEDTQNLVHLVKEMRAAWGKQYGISVTLAPDYWYLRFFDPAAMYDSVDWFGFVAYDLHGSWDADVHALGSIVRGQTDIREIKNDTLPFWFDNIDPAKLNLGLAAYGRGYTLSDPSCHSLGCPFDGPNLAAQCTNQAGIASLVEIKNLVNELKLTETLLSGSMMKQISWGDQWIGYDDHDTWAMKKKWADGLCFGGTMVWSVDLDSGSGR